LVPNFNRGFRDFLAKKTIIFSENGVSGLQNEHNIGCPKNDFTTVFVVQSTDPPIKNGVKDNLLGWAATRSKAVSPISTRFGAG